MTSVKALKCMPYTTVICRRILVFFLNFILQDDQFGNAGGLLKGSAQRLSKVISSAGSDRKCMCYMILGLVGAFFVLYYGLGWIKT